MTKDKTIRHYQDYLRLISNGVAELAENTAYVQRLIKGDNLLPIDRALKEFIELYSHGGKSGVNEKCN